MLVDDSAVIRGLMTRWLREDGGFEIVASLGDGAQAVRQIERARPEVVVLDIEMPQMDGLTALPLLLRAVPGVKVIMASTLTERNAEISLRAMAAGAADYLAKPSSTRDAGTVTDYQRDLVAKLKVLGEAARRGSASRMPRVAAPPSATTSTASAQPRGGVAATGGVATRGGVAARGEAPARPRLGPYGATPIRLRQHRVTLPKVMVVGSSTGGPQALFALFQNLKDALRVPVLVTQHMPATFTRILAEHLARVSGMTASEAKDGEPLESGRIYVAPGDWHMEVAAGAAGPVARLNQKPPENFCRPAVDPLFRSVSEVYGAGVLAVVLTGMGQDGLLGARTVVERGGTLLAQDEASSVVWGMPGAVATDGLCTAVLPLSQLPDAVRKVLSGMAP